MWIIGLTGAMGAGKSTLSRFFQLLGIPVLCADTVIHHLLDSDPGVYQKIKSLWPNVFVQGKIDRLLLGEHIMSSPTLLRTLEGVLYPQLTKIQKTFLQNNQKRGTLMVVLDTPLLLEVGLGPYCHCIILAVAPYFLRKQRVLRRKGMSLEKFNYFESQRMGEKESARYADFRVPTGRGKGSSLKRIEQIIELLSRKPTPKWEGRWPSTLKRDFHDKRNCSRYRNNRI